MGEEGDVVSSRRSGRGSDEWTNTDLVGAAGDGSACVQSRASVIESSVRGMEGDEGAQCTTLVLLRSS